jgi:hypothetical protein
MPRPIDLYQPTAVSKMSSNTPTENPLPNMNDAVATGASASVDSAPAAPRRDKLAAMAHRAAAVNNTGSSTAISNATTDKDIRTSPTTPSAQVVETPASTPALGGRGSSKLAALAARQQQQQQASNVETQSIQSTAPKAGKNLTRLLQRTDDSESPSTNNPQQLSQNHEQEQMSPEELVKKKAEYLTTLQQRMKKRNQLLYNLDQAEEMTCQLLSIAGKTTDALQNVHWASDGTGTLFKLSTAFASTIQAIHPLIAGDNDEGVAAETLVKAYQNHGSETKQSMYAARIELRLAAEKCQVLKIFAELEQQEHNVLNEKDIQIDNKSRKRSREVEELASCR